MAATITYASNRVTITGPYKEFIADTGSSATLVRFASGEQPSLSPDKNRLILWCKGGIDNTSQWQTRKITNVSGTATYVHDPWIGTPQAGDTFRISSTMDDIITAQPLAGSKTGNSSFAMDGDMQLNSDAFFGSLDESVDWVKGASSSIFPMQPETVLQLGVLWGGESTGNQTTNGSRWSIRQTASSNTSIYSGTNSRLTNGFIVNFYGSLIETSYVGGYLFQRMRGPTRFIGCVFDGVMGGRFYHEASEWVDCRMSGNDNSTPAWSIGATFNRPIENIYSFRNLFSMKSYINFGGTLRNMNFQDNNKILFRSASSASSVFNFIDSTEFNISDTSSTGGTVNQFKSVNISTTNSEGVALEGVRIRVNDKNNDTQSSILVSDVNGDTGEILARRNRMNHGSGTLLTYSPFRIRLRKYGYLWTSLSSSIADPIKQSQALSIDPNVTQTETQAQSYAGQGWIDFTDHGGSPVTWQGKQWGITVSVNSVNMDLDAVKHYLHYYLSQGTSVWGREGLDWHNFIPMNSTETQNGTYGSVTKGVRVIVQGTSDPFPGVTRMQADDGTYYVPPTQYAFSFNVNPSITNYEWRIYQVDNLGSLEGSIELAGQEVASSSSQSYNYQHSSDITIALQIISQPDNDFEENITYYTLSNSNQNVNINLINDNNN